MSKREPGEWPLTRRSCLVGMGALAGVWTIGGCDPSPPPAPRPEARKVSARPEERLLVAIALRWSLLDGSEVARVRDDWVALAARRRSASPDHARAYAHLDTVLGAATEPGAEEVVLDHLLAGPAADDDVKAVRTCVVLEAARLLLANGGFKSVGYANYRGWPGGVLDGGPLPYRTE